VGISLEVEEDQEQAASRVGFRLDGVDRLQLVGQKPNRRKIWQKTAPQEFQ
jgi:hypothetical protein